jgi:hypothetical protein
VKRMSEKANEKERVEEGKKEERKKSFSIK